MHKRDVGSLGSPARRLRVLEFGTYLCAPLLGRYLADMRDDFEVIRVEKPERVSHDERAYMRRMRHDVERGKACVQLDLPSDVARAMALVADVDIVVENLAPGVMDRLGVGATACRQVNPDLLYVSLPGYAAKDDCGAVAAWDSIIMASSGVFRDMGLNRQLLGIRASFSDLPMPSVYASVFGLFAVLAAVYNEDWGQHIRVPLASALSEALVHNSLEFPVADFYMSRRAKQVRTGPFPVTEAQLAELVDPFFCKYMCSDGRPIYVVCPAHSRHQTQLLKCLGVYDQVVQVAPHVASAYAAHPEHGIGSGCLSREQAEAVRPVLARAFSARSAFEWERVLGTHAVPAIAHKTADEWTATRHCRESGLASTDDEGRTVLGPITWCDARASASADWSRQVCSDLKVIDLTNVIAGPTIGGMLARLGADVIKVDAPRPLYAPDVTVVYGLVTNMNKRSVLLDVSTEGGYRALRKLVASADVILVNATDDCLRRMRLDADAVRAMNPDVVLARFDAWGGPVEAGEYRHFVGYDDNVQAGIGIMTRFGGGLCTAEEHAHIGTIDVIAGVAGAAAVMHALHMRKVRSVVATARTSLAACGQYLQYPFMFGTELAGEAAAVGRGLTRRGAHDLHCCYQAADGEWVLLVACLHVSGVEAFFARNALGVRDASALAAFVRSRDSVGACRDLNAAGVAATPLASLADVRDRHIVAVASMDGMSYQYLSPRDHPIGSLTIVAPVAIRMRGMRYALAHAPKHGTHTYEVLDSVGETKLLLNGITARVAWSREYMPYTVRCDRCGVGSRMTQLSCEHRVCVDCLSRDLASQRCPVCRVAHRLDVFELRRTTRAWASAYGDWRRGGVRGSQGELAQLLVPKDWETGSEAAPRRRHSFPRGGAEASACG